MPGVTLANPGIMLANGAGIHAKYSQYFRAYMFMTCTCIRAYTQYIGTPNPGIHATLDLAEAARPGAPGSAPSIVMVAPGTLDIVGREVRTLLDRRAGEQK